MSPEDKTRALVEFLDTEYCQATRDFGLMRFCVHGMVHDPWGTAVQPNSGDLSLMERLDLGRRLADKARGKP